MYCHRKSEAAFALGSCLFFSCSPGWPQTLCSQSWLCIPNPAFSFQVLLSQLWTGMPALLPLGLPDDLFQTQLGQVLPGSQRWADASSSEVELHKPLFLTKYPGLWTLLQQHKTYTHTAWEVSVESGFSGRQRHQAGLVKFPLGQRYQERTLKREHKNPVQKASGLDVIRPYHKTSCGWQRSERLAVCHVHLRPSTPPRDAGLSSLEKT